MRGVVGIHAWGSESIAYDFMHGCPGDGGGFAEPAARGRGDYPLVHLRLDSERVRAAGYPAPRTLYECLAAGQNTPERAVEFWKMQSPSDREALLDPTMRDIGIGYAFRSNAPYRYYWTVVLAAP